MSIADGLRLDRVSPHADAPILAVASEVDTPVQPEPVKAAGEKSVVFDLRPTEWEFEPDGERADGDGERRRERGRKERRREGSPASDGSDETVELPRFDGARDEDPLAVKLESVLVGLFR